MSESVIMAVTNDIYELPIMQFDSYKQMAAYLGISIKHCHCIVSKGTIWGKRNCKFIKVDLENEDENEESQSM